MDVMITGGAGFIGCNVARYHLDRGDRVILLDNLSRAGSTLNLQWLQEAPMASRLLSFVRGDIRNLDDVKQALSGRTARVYHCAAQVAVTTSVRDPRDDFEANALGTFNVLEGVRAVCPEAVLIYASTNKVYGALDELRIEETEHRYACADLPHGVPESQPLDFYSPYGCSKGAGDQYVRDYARIYGLRTVVMRQSCIYGTRQFGIEDQGWLAHFLIRAFEGRPVTIFGNGKQVRDVLWIDDLIDVYEAAARDIDTVKGEIFNIGGGPGHTVSIWREFGPLIEGISGRLPSVQYATWRPGDQPLFISDIRKAETLLGWRPQVGLEDGVERLWRWIHDNMGTLKRVA